METQYTGKDHMAAVFGQGQTDRIAVRALQGFRPIMDRVDVSGKEAGRQDRALRSGHGHGYGYLGIKEKIDKKVRECEMFLMHSNLFHLQGFVSQVLMDITDLNNFGCGYNFYLTSSISFLLQGLLMKSKKSYNLDCSFSSISNFSLHLKS